MPGFDLVAGFRAMAADEARGGDLKNKTGVGVPPPFVDTRSHRAGSGSFAPVTSQPPPRLWRGGGSRRRRCASRSRRRSAKLKFGSDMGIDDFMIGSDVFHSGSTATATAERSAASTSKNPETNRVVNPALAWPASASASI